MLLLLSEKLWLKLINMYPEIIEGVPVFLYAQNNSAYGFATVQHGEVQHFKWHGDAVCARWDLVPHQAAGPKGVARGRGNPSPPNRKNCWRKWCYLRRLYF